MDVLVEKFGKDVKILFLKIIYVLEGMRGGMTLKGKQPPTFASKQPKIYDNSTQTIKCRKKNQQKLSLRTSQHEKLENYLKLLKIRELKGLRIFFIWETLIFLCTVMSFPCFTIPYRNEIIGDGERKEIKWSIKVFPNECSLWRANELWSYF